MRTCFNLALAAALLFVAGVVCPAEPQRITKETAETTEQAVALLSEIKALGVSVFVEDVRKPIVACYTGVDGQHSRFGFFGVEKGRAFLVLCSAGLNADSLFYLLRHEAAHVIQWCQSGRPEDIWTSKPISPWVTEDAQKQANGAMYKDFQRPLEADAFTFAELFTLQDTREVLKERCKPL